MWWLMRADALPRCMGFILDGREKPYPTRRSRTRITRDKTRDLRDLCGSLSLWHSLWQVGLTDATSLICAMSIDDLSYKNAVIYCLDVEKYQDRNNDGIGDFEGLM